MGAVVDIASEVEDQQAVWVDAVAPERTLAKEGLDQTSSSSGSVYRSCHDEICANADSHTGVKVIQYEKDLAQMQAGDGKAELVEALESGTGQVAGRKSHCAVGVALDTKAVVAAGVGSSHGQKTEPNLRASPPVVVTLEPVVAG